MARKLKCSFCRRTEHEVEKLAAGRRTLLGGRPYICKICADAASAIMAEGPDSAAPAPREDAQRWTVRLRGWLGGMRRSPCSGAEGALCAEPARA